MTHPPCIRPGCPGPTRVRTMLAAEEAATPLGCDAAGFICDKCGARFVHYAIRRGAVHPALNGKVLAVASSSPRRIADTDARPTDEELEASIARGGLGK